VSRESLADQAYAELRSAIAGGVLAPDTQVVESSLAGMLNISRTPVREALRRCELEGYLRRDGTGKLVVHRPTAAEMRDLFFVRELLESYAVRMAAERISDEELERLDELVAADRRALKAQDVGELASLNERIHGLIVRASRNRTLDAMVSGLPGRAYGLHTFAVGSQEQRAVFVSDHGELAEFLRAGDGDGAEALIRRHLGLVRDLLVAGLDVTSTSSE
jgi:DNA-binding GntR family transcriptional regulator